MLMRMTFLKMADPSFNSSIAIGYANGRFGFQTSDIPKAHFEENEASYNYFCLDCEANIPDDFFLF